MKNPFENISKKLLASKRWYVQLLGAFLLYWKSSVCLLLMLVLFFVGVFNEGGNPSVKESVLHQYSQTDSVSSPLTMVLYNDGSKIDSIDVTLRKAIIRKEKCAEQPSAFNSFVSSPWYVFSFITSFFLLCIKASYRLTRVFSLRKEEHLITKSQICVLLIWGLWIISIVVVFDIKSQPRLAAALGIAGSVIGWIFQDTIKGVIAFIHLRRNELLHIDDWIQVPEHCVDGEVKAVTLTTVTLYNWDTTTSSIPTSMLYSGHFINLKNMMDGKTYGRKMSKTFIFDTGWFREMTQEDINNLRMNVPDVINYLSEKELSVASKMTNAHLFRLYLYHWLMNHPHISQQPRLIVRWLDQIESGMPLEIYAFIIDSGLLAFEWQQSIIIEHVIDTVQWFGLRLYQTPSAYDVSNSNIYMSDNPATYKNE